MLISKQTLSLLPLLLLSCLCSLNIKEHLVTCLWLCLCSVFPTLPTATVPMSPPAYFPLRWESTGDQWWYASPIDYAAANGHYDLVRELLRIDSNNLMKLTSLRRIRRLETVWDDESQFHDVSACRSRIARKLFSACDVDAKANTLIRAGYGGWLMYTAASAGDLGFVRDLLARNPLLVFGEGEYGVTDMLYAAARSRNDDVFRLIFDFAVSPRFVAAGNGGLEQQIGEIPAGYRWEMKNRAAHAASRGGNLTLLKEILSECSVEDVLSFRDKQGSTILHAAAGKGMTHVVKQLVASFDIINVVDNQGNTALHVAAYRGHAAVVEALIANTTSLITARNNGGDTFLHAGISGFQTPAFERLDRHRELMNRLITSVSKSLGHVEDIVNSQNNEGRTALHLAISGNVPLEFVEMLMSVKSIDVNIRDTAGMTPLDLLRQKPHSPSSDLLIRRLVSAGGIFSSRDHNTRRVIASHLKDQGSIYSPGTRFRTPDTEIFLFSGLEAVPDITVVPDNVKTSSCSIDMSQLNVTDENHVKKPRNSSVNSAAERLKSVFHWPRTRKPGNLKDGSDIAGKESSFLGQQETHVPLRQRFSKPSPAVPNVNNNKRALSVRSNQSSPRAKKKVRSRSSSFSRLSIHSSSCSSTSSFVDLKQKGVLIDPGPSSSNHMMEQQRAKGNLTEKQGSIRRRLKGNYFCFGASGLSVKTPSTRTRENPSVISVN
ncbi:PREDICTED: serine/threonine-protein phosphatase 6 regulatory ankyrin repeat subunit B [Tarenaya hassleriana]|uniref:serine/threonine-protein phosphatase 6 regulatory ankyrin repeat subunit B n=1 Tax=Tarenaya hassleriana TaxID=28532 RepID=UPI00053C2661|nr:PREDICTED: serine/threonine-protein phosphatase 6 regulatory ankyrin repeat subunit B [Tarenaya hassleriana]